MSSGMTKDTIELDDSLGEKICDKCGGRGTLWDGEYSTLTRYCDKCWGKGKLDWIEQAVGAKPPENNFGCYGTSGAMGVSGCCGTSGVIGPNGATLGNPTLTGAMQAGEMFSYNDSLLDKFADEMAKDIANDIDKEILSEIMKEYDHAFSEQTSVINSFNEDST